MKAMKCLKVCDLMRRFSFVLLFIAAFLTANSQNYREAKDVIRWSDFDHEERVMKTAEFGIGDASYRLEYYISANPDNDERCFLFNNDRFKGGLLIATDKSEVVSMEIKWNNMEQTYTETMFMFVTGNDEPWESVAQVMALKNDSKVVGKFYSYSLENHEYYGDEDITVITPETPCSCYAVTPGYLSTVIRDNYVFEFIITRRFEADADKGYVRVSDISADDCSNMFLPATAKGKVLTVGDSGISALSCNIDTENTLFPADDTISGFMIGALDGDEFRLMDKTTEKYLTVDGTGDLALTDDNPSYFTIINDILTHAGTGAQVVYDGTKYTTAALSRAGTPVETVSLYKSQGSAETGLLLPEDSGDTEPQYYTLQGIRLSGHPAAPGIYISRQGNTAAKFVVK